MVITAKHSRNKLCSAAVSTGLKKVPHCDCPSSAPSFFQKWWHLVKFTKRVDNVSDESHLFSTWPSQLTLSRFRCGCHGSHVDTGRWVDTERKDRLCQVCHSLQGVKDEQHFILDCPAYSHIRNKHANLFQQTCTAPGFTAKCEPDACDGLLKESFSCRKCILSN